VGRRSIAAIAVALAAATFAAYAPVLGNGFVLYDDDIYVTECAPVRAGLTREGLAWAFGSLHGANWFPLTRLSWMLDAELFGVDARAFHATSLVLHVASALLLFAAFARITGAVGRSAFVAGVFALHPLHVESVAWAAARKDVLSGLFFALGLLAHERLARLGASPARRAAVAACMALGLLAKPILVAFPIALLLLDAWPLGRLGPAPGRRGLDAARLRAALAEKAELFALALAAGVVTLIAQRAGGALQALDAVPLGARVANALVATVGYLRRALWPDGLAVFYPHPHGGLPAWQVAGAAALLLAATLASLRAWPRHGWLATGWLWFLALLAPVIGIVQVGGQAAADRYTYLPLVGLALALAWAACELAARSPARRALPALALAVLAAQGVATFRQVRVWRDTESLFTHALAVTERNTVAHVNLGIALARDGRLEPAEAHARAALALSPGFAHAHALLAEVRARQGRHEEAIASYEAALRALPDTVSWHVEIGRALAALGRREQALARLERAVSLGPANASALGNLGRALFDAGRADAAIPRYREALRLRPDLAELHGQLGAALLARGEAREAAAALERAAALQPEVAAWRVHLARARAQAGDREAALAALDVALALAPDDGALHAERAALLETLGRGGDAAAAWRESLRLGPRDPRALNNLAWILATHDDPRVRDPAQAVALAEEAVAATAGAQAGILDTLAVAYAAADRPADARDASQRALALAEASGDTPLATEIRARLSR
jgi:tetratricopeptide (TPR) repeat protein